jgi:hypothetical protein
MPRPKPNRLHDELDALIDGRPVELTEELAPLVETADALRAELATLELDPAVADRHLERILHGSATVVRLPARLQPGGWDVRRRVVAVARLQPGGWDVRRRVVAVALAATLVLAPATLASAAALPGQAMYPFKLAIEQLRIASVQWSPAREAGERTRVADERLNEVEDLVRLKMFNQLPSALASLERAVVAAQVAVKEAAREGEPVSGVLARLSRVKADGSRVVLRVADAAGGLPPGTRRAIEAAVVDTQDVLPPPDQVPQGTPTPTTSPAAPGQGPDPTSAPSPPPTVPPTTAPPPTLPPTTVPPTTEPPTTAPPTTESTAAPESAGAAELGAGRPAGVAELGAGQPAGAEGAPPTTLPSP